MNQINAAVDQYEKTILNLSTRLANAAAELFAANEQIVKLESQLKEKNDAAIPKE